jgi:biotin carboxyl carrier protein
MTELVGTVRAVRSATLAPLIGGTVAEIRVGLGSSVRTGEVLVRLSAREAGARLEQTRAVSALAKRERDRAVTLRDQEVISVAQYEAALSQWSVAQARETEARTLAERTLLRAPFAGVVTAKLANVGDTAMPGQALLVLEAPGALRFETRVPETAAGQLEAGGLSGPVDGLDHDREDASPRSASPDDATAPGWAVDLGHPRVGLGIRSGAARPAAVLPWRFHLRRPSSRPAPGRVRWVRHRPAAPGHRRARDGRLEIAAGLSGEEGRGGWSRGSRRRPACGGRPVKRP